MTLALNRGLGLLLGGLTRPSKIEVSFGVPKVTHRRGPRGPKIPRYLEQTLPTSASKRSTWNRAIFFFLGGGKAKTGTDP